MFFSKMLTKKKKRKKEENKSLKGREVATEYISKLFSQDMIYIC